jgi:hypothetical protein
VPYLHVVLRARLDQWVISLGLSMWPQLHLFICGGLKAGTIINKEAFFFVVSLVPGRIDYASMGFDRICLSSVSRPNTTLGPAHLAQLPAGWAA